MDARRPAGSKAHRPVPSGDRGLALNLPRFLRVFFAFREEDCRIRDGEAAQNFAILRRIAFNLLKKDTSTKLGIANKRLKAGWNVDYFANLLGLAI